MGTVVSGFKGSLVILRETGLRFGFHKKAKRGSLCTKPLTKSLKPLRFFHPKICYKLSKITPSTAPALFWK